ncbi:replication initiator protein A [Fusobacterium necrophorum]|uniref:replication initiator protein A n=1 Tax=Fusobacterium necrophorum TaxID=859 RepID=UPI00254E8799|nr:replication initiator protein A [Fusobacterium necrophorum]MDK4483573.1 replication initiator protein A [Fusobacterium necrophorum]MDK4499994.1 replication initiator protein A [Fusobacterium necrophorum]MDK4508000.1 replication initiator protein A [Fusobacterium necrophorum]
MEYITLQDIDKQGYYQLDKKLFNNPHYQKEMKRMKKVPSQRYVDGKLQKYSKEVEIITKIETLSDTSKILYSFLLDQLKLSLENGWWDEKRRVYIRFSVQKLALLMNKSKDTIVKCKKELEENELVQIVSKDQFESDIFYLGKVKERPIQILEEELSTSYTTLSTSRQYRPVEDVDQYAVESVDLVEDVDQTKSLNFQEKNSSLVDVVDSTNSSSYINKTTTANINNNKYIIELLEKHKISKGTIKNILNLTRDISEEEIAAALSKMHEKKWGEGALYKALKEEWIRSEEKMEAEQSTEKINAFIQGIYNQQLAYLELYGYKNSSKLQAIENFEERIKKINPDYLNTECYKKFLQRLENIAVTNDKEPISSPFQAEQKRFLKNSHRIGGSHV